METSLAFVILVIAVALIYDFVNGFHDAANSIATVVATGTLKPRQAVIWAAVFNFIAFLFFGTAVASTIGKGVIDPSIITPALILSALLGAIIWNLITWYYGIPSSSSHALIGGLVGGGLASGGAKAIVTSGMSKIAISIVLSPVIGLVLAIGLNVLMKLLAKRLRPESSGKVFRRMQLASAAAYSLGHGGNDAQKTMGIIVALLYSVGQASKAMVVPLWVVLICQAAMGLGTLFGGWRIVETMGKKITELQPSGGCAAETAGAITLFAATSLGIPVSTTHTITGAIVGVGVSSKQSLVNWGVMRRIFLAWILTIPAAATISALCVLALKLIL
jgi:PiT family inorganic phosphate transporter